MTALSWYAPGRVNLIGEHTDYNDGLALPVALDRGCVATLTPRDDDLLTASSIQLGQGPAVPLRELPAGATGWSAYVLGIAWVLREAGVPVRGADLLVDCQVPPGAGLSSSAAVQCAVALVLCEAADVALPVRELARLVQCCENEVVGAPTGQLDQLAVLLGRHDSAVLLDFRTSQHRAVPLGLHERDVLLVVVDTGTQHAHATGDYADRRRACEQAAAALGVPALRDATPELLDQHAAELGDELTRRARHVVTEDQRVRDTVHALEHDDLEQVGRLLQASHVSLRDDFEVSVPALDVAVAAAVGAGALGARMTGGGFGGSAVALVPRAALDAVRLAVVEAAARHGHPSPQLHAVRPGAGAHRVEVRE